MDAPRTPPKPIASPCVLVCMIDPRTGFCFGCHRTEAEIEQWSRYSDAQRAALMAQIRSREKNAG